jgi:transcriptional regulator with XRE-family HTH domain
MADDDKHSVMDRLARKRGQEIRRAREAREMSQADLAKAAGTSQQTVDRIERGAVGHSRAYPKLRDALGLDKLGYDNWPLDEDEHGNLAVPPRRVEAEIRAIERVDRGMVPVITNSGGQVRLVDAIPRGYPYEHVQDVNAVLISDATMEPILRPGDIVVLHPHLPATVGDLVCFARDEVIYVRLLSHETEVDWVVESLNPPTTREIKKTTLAKLDVGVTRIMKR